MNKKKQYNAVYRLRKKGVEVSTPNKTVYAVEDISNNNTLKILLREFHFVFQRKFF